MRLGVRTRRRGMLDKILIPKRAEVARMQASVPTLPGHRPGGGVPLALARDAGEGALRIIAEVKFRSPSAGPLSRALGAGPRALAYARAGAAMVSVLVDRLFFDGGWEDLAEARAQLDAALGETRPRLLCKEFVLHPVQLDRAAAAGADAVLLIARIVTARDLAALAGHARERGLEPLVEVATEEELSAALEAGAKVVGVNARDLNTLQMDAARAARVLDAVPRGVVAVHLSGLGSPADVERVARTRADAALIGEALMREDDPEPLLAAMVVAGRARL
jgi:indole-3-glycerol phosphate synthase